MRVDPAVWRALSNSAELGNLYRCVVLDRITCGYPVRTPWGGWGYQDGERGEVRFPDAMSAHVALTAFSTWWQPI